MHHTLLLPVIHLQSVRPFATSNRLRSFDSWWEEVFCLIKIDQNPILQHICERRRWSECFSRSISHSVEKVCTCEGNQAGQTQAVGEDNKFYGLQTSTGCQQAAVQELQDPVHTGRTGVRNGYLQNDQIRDTKQNVKKIRKEELEYKNGHKYR